MSFISPPAPTAAKMAAMVASTHINTRFAVGATILGAVRKNAYPITLLSGHLIRPVTLRVRYDAEPVRPWIADGSNPSGGAIEYLHNGFTITNREEGKRISLVYAILPGSWIASGVFHTETWYGSALSVWGIGNFTRVI